MLDSPVLTSVVLNESSFLMKILRVCIMFFVEYLLYNWTKMLRILNYQYSKNICKKLVFS